jgi:hypothetical protein
MYAVRVSRVSGRGDITAYSADEQVDLPVVCEETNRSGLLAFSNREPTGLKSSSRQASNGTKQGRNLLHSHGRCWISFWTPMDSSRLASSNPGALGDLRSFSSFATLAVTTEAMRSQRLAARQRIACSLVDASTTKKALVASDPRLPPGNRP